MNQSTKNYKNFSIFFAIILCVACVISALLGILLYIYDPFMFFHKPYFREWTFASDRRLVVKGMVDFVEFDSAIFGSSMLENTLSKEADEKIGGKWLNLAINSSRIYEREALIQYILKHKEIKQIIYALENYLLVNGKSKANEKSDFKPLNLNRSFKQNFNIYLDSHFIKCALKWSRKKECVGRDLNTFADWHSENYLGFKNWGNGEKEMLFKELELYKNDNYQAVEFRSAETQQYIKEHILVYVKQNPQITFHFVLPTQSRFFWKIPYFGIKANAHQSNIILIGKR